MIDFLMKHRGKYLILNLAEHYRYTDFFLLEVWDKFIQGNYEMKTVYSDGKSKIEKFFVTIPIDKIISIEEERKE